MRTRLVGLALLGSLSFACTPTCEQVCSKLHSCDELNLDNRPETECKVECQFQQGVYEARNEDEDEPHPEKLEAFEDYKRCIDEASCDDLVAGECYDPELYAF